MQYPSMTSANIERDPIATVVIGRNEGQRLLDSLSSLARRNTRTIYVDSGSTDGSSEAARRMGIQAVDLDRSLPFTAARARNAGLLAALKRWPYVEFVQFLDGDCLLDLGWIDTAYEFIRTRDDVAMVFGRRRERRKEASVFNSLCDREWSGQPGEVGQCGGDVFARVAAIRDAGLYADELIAGEEPELCVRLREKGWKIWRLDAEMTLHDANMMSLRQWWRRNTRTGYAFAEVATLHWNSPFGIWKRSLLRAIGWGGVLPVATVAGAVLIHPLLFALLAFYPFQFARIAARENWSKRTSWRNGMFDILAKFAELYGAAKYVANRINRRRQTIIEYK